MDTTMMMGHKHPNRFKVIYGHIEFGEKPDGTKYAYVMSVTDIQHLPESLIETLPPRMLSLPQNPATDYLVVETFNGEINYP